MDLTRRKLLAVASTVSVAGLAGCTDLFSDAPEGTSTGTPANNTTTPTGQPMTPPPDESLPEGTEEHMAYLPAREGPPRKPPYYQGENPFDEPTELTVQTIEALPDDLGEGSFNFRAAFYQPREYITFAKEYWEAVFPNLTLNVDIVRVGDEPSKQRDIQVKWVGSVKSYEQFPLELRSEFGMEVQPLAYRPDQSQTVPDQVTIQLDSMRSPGIYKFALITAIGRAFGIQYDPAEESGIMNPAFLFIPEYGNELDRMYKDRGLREAHEKIVNTALNARRYLIQSQFTKAVDACDTGLRTSQQFITDVEPVITAAEDAGSEYGVLALRETKYFFQTDMNSVFEFIREKGENEDSTYSEDEDGEAPVLHAYQHKIFDSIKPRKSLVAGGYENSVGVDLDLRIGKKFNPEEYNYFSRYENHND